MKIIIMRLILCMIVSVGMFGCGGGGSSDEAAKKNLFSLWKDTKTSAPLDLTGGSFNTQMAMLFIFTGGAQCQCDLLMIGDQSLGVWSLSSCGYITGTGTSDPGCSTMNASGNYTLSSNTLSICGGNTPGCDTYR